MKSSYKFMQGASKSTGKSLDLQGFFCVLPTFIPSTDTQDVFGV